jgi:hypothetical protein
VASPDVTRAAQHGWDEPGLRNPHHMTSAEGMAFSAGRSMNSSGYTRPTRATMGRGYTVNVETAANRFKATFDRTMACRLERLGE